MYLISQRHVGTQQSRKYVHFFNNFFSYFTFLFVNIYDFEDFSENTLTFFSYWANDTNTLIDRLDAWSLAQFHEYI